MRKYSGLFIALILLALPALASAGQLTVKVIGGVAGSKYVALTGGAVKASITGGTNYYYPSTSTTVTVTGAGAVTTTSGALTGSGPYTYSGTGTAAITVNFPANTTSSNFTFTQPIGGTIAVQQLNGVFATGSPVNMPNGSNAPVIVSPDTNHNVTTFTIGGVAQATSAVAGQVVQGSVNPTVGGTNYPVVVVLGFVGKNVPTLKTPGTAFLNQAITVSATTTTNEPGTEQLAFAVTGCVAASQAAASPASYGMPVTFTFTPASSADCSIIATATSTHNAGTATPATLIPVRSAAAYLNNQCIGCHSTSTPAVIAAYNSTLHPSQNPTSSVACSACHNTSPHDGGPVCIGCHAMALNAGAGYVQDNSGVRAITSEFGKWSHHVTGRAVTDADCAVCHLEGKASGTDIVVSSYHMSDAKIHLRNCNTGLSGNQTTSTDAAGTVWASGTGLVQYAWDPATPNHTLMDQYCFSCHNSAGAPTAIAALAGVTNISVVATNPFNDTISNQYDLLSRGAVVDAFSQFATGNSSHHAVRGAKYTATSLPATTFTNISTYNAGVINSQFAGNGPAGLNTALAGNGYKGLRVTPNLKVATIKDAGFFATLYTPLGTATTLADNSTIHCGDCHTVGQFKPNYASNADGTFVNPAIGAHGSNNEYLLRKANGSESNAASAKDALVCYLCHAASQYQINFSSGGYPGEGGHAGIVSSAGGTSRECNTDGNNAAGQVGLARIVSESPATSMADPAVFNKVTGGNYAGNGGGNILGNKCLNCHNAGAGTSTSAGKGFGGIHGNANNYSYVTYSAANTWTSALGGGSPGAVFSTVSKKPYRFLPGLGNFRYNGGNSAAQWTQRSFQSGKGVKLGCYTLNGSSSKFVNGVLIPNVFPTAAKLAGTNVSSRSVADDNGVLGAWGSCSDHAGSSVSGVSETVDRTILRPLTY